MHDLDGLDGLFGAHRIAGDHTPEGDLLRRVGAATPTARTDTEHEPPTRDLLECGCHVREESGVAVRNVENEGPEDHPRHYLGERGEHGPALGRRGGAGHGFRA